MEVLRQSGFDDWKLYSRWRKLGVGDLYFYYQDEWVKAGTPEIKADVVAVEPVHGFALDKGALKKSDFKVIESSRLTRGTLTSMKYAMIPSVVKDICESY